VATATSPSTAPDAGLPGPTLRAVLADVALRLAQLDWPVACDLDRDERGREILILRRVDPSAPLPATHAGTFRVGGDVLGRPHLVDAILVELRARGWDRTPAPGIPRDDVRWCAPA
jgi:hypothetical protein